MGDNKSIRVVDVGIIQIDTYDIIKRILEAWHILELKKNIISLSTMDSHGYKYTGENSLLIISKGVLVIMKGKLIIGLYYLLDKIITNIVVVSSSSRLSNIDASQLWHISKREMIILSKRGLFNGVKIGELDFYEHHIFGRQCRIKFNDAIHRIKGTSD